MNGELGKVLWVCSILFMSDAFMYMDGWMDEWKSFSGLSSIIPDPTNLRDYKPRINEYWIDVEVLMII